MLHFVKIDTSVINTAMKHATTKPVIGTVEIATPRKAKKENAHGKNPPSSKNIGKIPTVLLHVHGTISEILRAIMNVTAKPVVGTVEIATKNTEELTLASVLRDVNTSWSVMVTVIMHVCVLTIV